MGIASLSNWDRYTFQNGQLAVAMGCNIYAAAIGTIRLALGGLCYGPGG